MAHSNKRVVITGMGAVTPVGLSVAETYRSCIEGKSGVAPITRFTATSFPTSFAAEVKGFDLSKFIAQHKMFDYCGVNGRFGAAAASQALKDANLISGDPGAKGVDRTRFGLYLGSGEGITDFEGLISNIVHALDPATGQFDPVRFCQLSLTNFHGENEAEQEFHTAPAHLADLFDLQGPNYNCLTACAASAQALGEALEMIRRGDADVMLVGGSHSMIHPLGVTGFNLLTALSQHKGTPETASRPFDLHRDGFVLGEGAAMVVLEDLEHAKKRGARIYGELIGYRSTADAFRVTDSHPEGRGAIACIEGALKDAGVGPEDIQYINAHGTSTQVNDRVESLAIKHVFGEHAYEVPTSSTKSCMGHMIAAAGAVELILCVETMRNGIIPPTINYETPDPECDLDYVPNKAREAKVDCCLSNSFGFGGQNTSLVVRRFSN